MPNATQVLVAAFAFFVVVLILALPGRWDPAIRLKQWLEEKKRQGQYPLPPLTTNNGGGTRVHTFDEPEGVYVRDTDDGKRFAMIAKGKCPHCKQKTKFFAGPRGGMSQNISCEACGWWFNVTAFPNGEGIAQDIGFKSREVH